MKKWSLVSLIMSVMLVFSACSSQEASTQPEPEPVEKKVKVEKVKVESLGLSNMISAELMPSSKSTIVAQISGNVVKKNVQVGEQVTADQLLLELENEEMALSYQRDEISADKANLQVQKAKEEQNQMIKSAQTSVKEREIMLADAKNAKLKHEQAIEQAKQNVNKLNLQYDSMLRSQEEQKILLEYGKISQQDYNKLVDQVKNLEIDLNLAKAQVDQLIKDSQGVQRQIENAELQVTRAKQQLEQTKAQYNFALLDKTSKESQVAKELAKSQLDKRFIRSPISGVVVKLAVNEGDSINPQQVLADIEKHDVLHVSAYISEHEVAKIQGREKLDVYFPLTEEVREGNLLYISTSKNKEKNGYEVLVELKNEDLSLFPGMTTHLVLENNKSNKVVTIPTNAVIKEDDKNFVYVISNQVASKREVTVGETFKLKVSILKGLKEGESIAVVGQSLLQDQDKVKIIE